MNVLGLDVTGLDVGSWLQGTRVLFPLLSAAWLLLVLRSRRASHLLLGVLLANAWVWAAVNVPQQRPYGLGSSNDRLNNIGFCQVVANEGRPLQTFQVGQLHFEPFWGALVAFLVGPHPERLLTVYPYFALCMALAFALALWFGLKRPDEGEDGPWERALVAGFATLLSTAPLEFLGTYRGPWAMMFLLKPNHSLGLVLLPLVLLAFARMRGTAQRVLVGLLLQLVGWAFVIHMVFAVAGLLVFALEAWLHRRPERGRELKDVLVAVGVNVLIVSPYLLMLVAGYPFLQRLARNVIQPSSPHVMEGLFYSGWLALLTFWGLRVLRQRGDRLSRLWAAQWLAALAIWVACLGLSAVQQARELDEVYQWLRFTGAVLAGVGAWDLCRRLAEAWRAGAVAPALRAVALSALLIPVALPSFWDPLRMDPFFAAGLEPLPRALLGPAEWLRAHSRPGDVVAGDHDFAPWVAALVGRRVLVSDRLHMAPNYHERLVLERDLLLGSNARSAHEQARRYGVRFLTVTRPVLNQHRAQLEALKARADLRLGYEAPGPVKGFEPLAIFELLPERLP